MAGITPWPRRCYRIDKPRDSRRLRGENDGALGNEYIALDALNQRQRIEA